MQTRSYSEVRETLKACLDEVQDSRAPLLITRQRGGNAVLIAESEWNSIAETLHVTSTRANARHLLDSMDSLDGGDTVDYDQARMQAAE